MPRSEIRPYVWGLDTLLGLWIGGLLLSGCDGTGSKRASLYERLVGTWTVERVERLGQGIDPDPRFENRYSWVRFDFRGGEGGRDYRVTAQRSGDTTTVVLAAGPVRLRDEQRLQMIGGFTSPSGLSRVVTWTFGFEASRAVFRLPPGQSNGSRAFMSTLLPTIGWSESQGVRLQLAPDEESG